MITVERAELLTAIEKVKRAYSIPPAKLRYPIKGILFWLENGILDVVATNGARIHLYRIDTYKRKAKGFKVFIEKDEIPKLVKCIKEADSPWIEFPISKVKFVKNPEYPDYVAVFQEAKVKREGWTLLNITRLKEELCRKGVSLKDTELELQLDGDRLKGKWRLIKDGEEIWHLTGKLRDFECYDMDETYTFRFNPYYIRDCLRSFDSYAIEILFSNLTPAILFRSIGEKQFSVVIAPIGE